MSKRLCICAQNSVKNDTDASMLCCVEMSLKAWQCGGAVEVATCSRVGQIHLDSELAGLDRGQENVYIRYDLSSGPIVIKHLRKK